MPYVNMCVSKKLNDNKRDSLKNRMGEVIDIIPGKSESVLMVQIDDGLCIYYGGEKKQNAAYVDVKIHQAASYENKEELTKKIFKIMSEDLRIEKEDLFVTISEFDNWGFQGNFV